MKNYLTIIAVIFMGIKTNASGYKIGDHATDFSLKNVDGKMVSLASLKEAKGYIVIFTCNHCPFAKAYEQRIIELDKKYASLGYPVIAINPNDASTYPEDSFENMVKRSEEKSYTFPYLYDNTQEIAAAYGATRTPHVYLLQKVNDKLIVKYIGAIDNNSEDGSAADKKYVADAIDALLNGTDVPVSETKAIGCTIKWKKND